MTPPLFSRWRHWRGVVDWSNSTQAGMNFSYRGKLANGKHASVKIFRPLPHTNQPPRVTNVLVASVEGDTMTVEKMWDEAVQGAAAE